MVRCSSVWCIRAIFVLKKVSASDWLPHPIFQSRAPSLSSPLCQLILPQDRPPSQCLPGWLLSSEASCPRWHELMIGAQASQPSLIHYVSQPGPHRFWHSLHGTEQRRSQITLFTPPPVPWLCCGTQHVVDKVEGHKQNLALGCAVTVGFFKHRSYPTPDICRHAFLTQLAHKAKRQQFCCPSKDSNCPHKSERSDSSN